MNKKTSLPKGYTLRTATPEDAANVVELLNFQALHYFGHKRMTKDVLLRDWSAPRHEPEKDTRLVFDPHGKLAGFVDIYASEIPPVHPFFYGCVHPQHENLGIGSFLLEWAESRARDVLPITPPELRVSVRTGAENLATAAIRLFGEHGYKPVRSWFEMQLEMSQKPPEPRFPEGIVLKPFDLERDAKAVYLADQDAFRDHFGFMEEPFEEGFQNFLHHFTQHESYDPDLWFIAWDGDEIAATCLCKKWAEDDKNTGYISSLGVRRQWRKKGLGTALLYKAFSAFYERGKRKVSLIVDSESLTGALDLYKRVGMHINRHYISFEKELRPGKEIIVQNLDDAS